MLCRAVARELAEDDAVPHAEHGRRRPEDIGVALRMLGVGIRMQLQQIQAKARVIPRPEVVEPRAPDGRDRTRMLRVHQLAQACHDLRKQLERHGTGNVRAEIAFPFLDDEVRLVHELVAQDSRGEIRSLARWSVPPDERDEHPLEEAIAPGLREQDMRTAVR
jgi:hypothetical protein